MLLENGLTILFFLRLLPVKTSSFELSQKVTQMIFQALKSTFSIELRHRVELEKMTGSPNWADPGIDTPKVVIQGQVGGLLLCCPYDSSQETAQKEFNLHSKRGRIGYDSSVLNPIHFGSEELSILSAPKVKAL